MLRLCKPLRSTHSQQRYYYLSIIHLIIPLSLTVVLVSNLVGEGTILHESEVTFVTHVLARHFANVEGSIVVKHKSVQIGQI